jgi:hypothetical protein
MQMVRLEPDDVLKGAGGYREVTEVECPVCGETTEVETETEACACGDCGAEFGIDKPFG